MFEKLGVYISVLWHFLLQVISLLLFFGGVTLNDVKSNFVHVKM